MTDTPEIAGDFDRRGTLMSERQSYERVIEGGKLASDGCRNLAAYEHGDSWDALADIMDQLRARCAALSGANSPADAAPSLRKFTSSALTRNESYNRVYEGLGMMAGGARQLAACHRGDVRWSKIAYMAHALRDNAGQLLRMKRRTIMHAN